MKVLKQALLQAAKGNGQIVSLVGEPGVGKSRLALELGNSPDAQGFLRLGAHAFSYNRRIAYFPIISLLRSYFDLRAENTISETKIRVARRLEELDPSLADVLPAVLWLFDVPTGEEDWDVLDPLIKRRKTMEAVIQLIFELAGIAHCFLYSKTCSGSIHKPNPSSMFWPSWRPQRQSCCF